MNTNLARIPMQSPAHLAATNAEGAIAGAAGTLHRLGFSPAFLDCATMRIHPSRFADGTRAQHHCLAGLPDDVVLRVVHAKAMLICGFERGGFFYTRRTAARACEQWAAALPGSIGGEPLPGC